MDAEQSDQLGQEVVFSEQTLGLVSIERLEVFLGDVRLVASLFDVVLLKHGELDQV